MKNFRLLLSLSTLALAAVCVRATALEKTDGYIRLPAYPVQVPRQNAVERQIARNLDELRARAHKPLTVKTDLPLLNSKNEAGLEFVKPAPLLAVVRS